MKTEELFEMLKDKDSIKFMGDCCDCGCEVTVTATVTTRVEISGGAVFTPPQAWHCPNQHLLKCQPCFDKAPHFYPKTEIYSRVVGYMRPVSQWNAGKAAEYAMRKNFEMPT